MTNEEKQLVIRDLCARLPYRVMCTIKGAYGSETDKLDIAGLEYFILGTIDVKLYLRPMSSMTEEEENEWCGLNIDPLLEAFGSPHTRIEDLMLKAKAQCDPIDWLNAHHFDYRGLIEKGLALEAPEGMYKTE